MSAPHTLEQWLDHIDRIHPRTVELGLERVDAVRRAMGLEAFCPLITVGGTNGKGSACAMLEAILDEAGYRTGCYTSPHIERYNERVRLGRRDASDEDLCAALQAVERARGDTSLTYFEFSTLAAMWLFRERPTDVVVLEVGLGGRLDAVNVFDADCALVMSVALDHMDYLGDTREAIGREKAGIYRPGRPAICADSDPPSTLITYAEDIGATLLLRGRDFEGRMEPRQWRYRGPRGERHGLPHPALRGDYQIDNAAACLAALDVLRDRLPVSANDIRMGLLTAENPARFQVLPGRPLVILDVAHNPAAADALARNVSRLPREGGRTLAVFAMLGDKDIDAVVQAVKGQIDKWFISGLEGARGTPVERVKQALERHAVVATIQTFESVGDAYAAAYGGAGQTDRIVVFGSFHTIAAVMAARKTA